MKSFVATIFVAAGLALDTPTRVEGCGYRTRENEKVCYRTYERQIEEHWRKVFCDKTKSVKIGKPYEPTGVVDFDEKAKKEADKRPEVAPADDKGLSFEMCEDSAFKKFEIKENGGLQGSMMFANKELEDFMGDHMSGDFYVYHPKYNKPTT